MRRFLLIALAAALPGLTNAGPRSDAAIANPFDEGRLQDKTLRIDYMFTGSDKDCDIAVAELLSLDGWHGRRTNMKVKAHASDHHTIGSRASSMRALLIIMPKLVIVASTPMPT